MVPGLVPGSQWCAWAAAEMGRWLCVALCAMHMHTFTALGLRGCTPSQLLVGG